VAVNRPGWDRWQSLYDDPNRAVAKRLRIVQRLIRGFLTGRGAEPVRVVSMCAGQGRDVLEVLADHPVRGRVRGRLVELEPANTAEAARRAREAGLEEIEVVTGDASVTDAYEGAVPADLVLACGIFGNIPDEDVRRTIGMLPQLCARGATVIWTRHRRPPDVAPTIRGWFADAGFAELAFESTEAEPPGPGAFPAQGVGAHRWQHDPVPLQAGVRMFTFFS
jgi:hypothetical protein